MVGLRSPGAEIRVNFGGEDSNPFVFRFDPEKDILATQGLAVRLVKDWDS
jgi:hypothetical protein